MSNANVIGLCRCFFAIALYSPEQLANLWVSDSMGFLHDNYPIEKYMPGTQAMQEPSKLNAEK
jgi:hypothetical protein